MRHEFEFFHYPKTDDLPERFLVWGTYETQDESFDAFNINGILETQFREDKVIFELEVWSKGELISPEALEPGLMKLIKEEALEHIQGL